MRVIIFGATGMIGQGILKECLADSRVQQILVVGRSTCGVTNDRLSEVLMPDLFDIEAEAAQLDGYDACFFCLGVSASLMDEARFRRLTQELTVHVATLLSRLNPDLVFTYISGQGTDASSKRMWARVKGETEQALLELPLRDAYMFRIGYVQPLDGIKSKTRGTRIMYALLGPLRPVLRLVFRQTLTTTRDVGRAMLAVVDAGYATRFLSNEDINALARPALVASNNK